MQKKKKIFLNMHNMKITSLQKRKREKERNEGKRTLLITLKTV